MKSSSLFLLITLAIGFTAQLLFFSRTFFQWILSEKAKKVLSPNIYWILSLIASLLFFIYGWLRNDFSILLGQSVTYYIYVLNLFLKKYWQTLHLIFRIFILVAPLIFFSIVIYQSDSLVDKLFINKTIPLSLLLFGSIGQLIFTFRFVYQIIYSYRRKISTLPIGFWWISLTGSILILAYGIFRLDMVLLIAQSCGLLAYIRNIRIHQRQEKRVLDCAVSE